MLLTCWYEVNCFQISINAVKNIEQHIEAYLLRCNYFDMEERNSLTFLHK